VSPAFAGQSDSAVRQSVQLSRQVGRHYVVFICSACGMNLLQSRFLRDQHDTSRGVCITPYSSFAVGEPDRHAERNEAWHVQSVKSKRDGRDELKNDSPKANAQGDEAFTFFTQIRECCTPLTYIFDSRHHDCCLCLSSAARRRRVGCNDWLGGLLLRSSSSGNNSTYPPKLRRQPDDSLRL
jgi:hypothetical protein